MAEPTVQVPVSLIERFLSLAGRADEAWANGVAGDFRALLSQPTPTAEHAPDCFIYHTGVSQKVCTCRPVPSIAAMVPGTTFTAAATSDIWRWAVRADGQVVSGLGIGPKSSIDPSTIRDVTPPSVTS